MLSTSPGASPREREQWSQSQRFTTLLDDMRRREEEREASYLAVIQSLEDDNKGLAGELEEMRERFSAAHEEQQLELHRMAQLRIEAKEVADDERRARIAATVQTSAVVRLASEFAGSTSVALLQLAFAEENEFRTLMEASWRSTPSMRVANSVHESEERERGTLRAWEEDAFAALCSAFDVSLGATVSIRELRSCIASTSELAADLVARSCLVEKEDIVLLEDLEWGRLVDDEESRRTEMVSALQRFASREASLFWDCCLEEAREVLRSVAAQNEVERLLLESCAERDLPAIIERFLDNSSECYSGLSPAASLHFWRSRVLDPILSAAAGTISVVQLMSSISLAVPSAQHGVAEDFLTAAE